MVTDTAFYTGKTALPGSKTAAASAVAVFWIVMIGLAMAWNSVFGRDNGWHELPAPRREGGDDD